MATVTPQNSLIVEATVNAPIDKVWKLWNTPEDITKWNNASDDWHSPRAKIDLTPGGKFNVRMEAKDGSAGFDFGGVYDKITPQEYIAYTMGDGRKVEIHFTKSGSATNIVEKFEPENENTLELQQTGWQSILDNFKKYAETK
ncbi:MAG: polyketide cyclase [Ignavibacteriae bacterium]|nr:MAG: polyketide cyclase [Ignavibacteriota bacterium]